MPSSSSETRPDHGDKTVTLTFREVCELAFTAAGSASVPFMRDHPSYVMPSEEIRDSVNQVIRDLVGIEPTAIRGYWKDEA